MPNGRAAGGVRVTGIVEDPSPMKRVYDPTHPDADEDGYVDTPNVDMVKEIADAMACHSSIRFNRGLTMEEMNQVIRDLQACSQPYHCPHGRPTVITLSDTRLRREFERG